jgi:hypothetical protein
MEWIVEPLVGFTAFEIEAADNCSGGGTLHHCETKGGLIICTCTGGLKVETVR